MRSSRISSRGVGDWPLVICLDKKLIDLSIYMIPHLEHLGNISKRF